MGEGGDSGRPLLGLLVTVADPRHALIPCLPVAPTSSKLAKPVPEPGHVTPAAQPHLLPLAAVLSPLEPPAGATSLAISGRLWPSLHSRLRPARAVLRFGRARAADQQGVGNKRGRESIQAHKS